MPIVKLSPDEVLPERTNYDLAIERDPTFSELIKANVDDGWLSTLVNRVARPNEEPDHTYDVFSDLHGYEGYADKFIGVEDRFTADRIKKDIDKQIEAKAVMASGGTAEGIAAGIAAGFTDPTMFIPIGGAAYKTYRTGGRILEGALRTAAVTGTITAATEVAMHELQETREVEESLGNVAGSVFLGGIVGSVAGALGSRAQFDALAKRVDDELRVPVNNDSSTVGAAAVDQTTLSDEALKSAAGLEKLLAFQDPTLRMANSPSKTMRQFNERLAESPLVKNKNTQGIASEVSVENRIKSYELPKYQYLKTRDDLFLKYRQSKSKLATEAGDLLFKRSRKDGKLTYNEFKEEISKAGRRGDKHEIPEVAEAARMKREMVTNPIFQEAKAVGLIDEDTTTPGTAESYVTRVWDHDKINANRREFEDINTKWLRAKRDKAANEVDRVFKTFDLDNGPIAEIFKQEKAAFRAAGKQTRTMERKISKTEGAVDKTEIRIDQADAQIREATRHQQRLYDKILRGRDRGEDELSDLFYEFKSVSSRKQELYRRLAAREGELAEQGIQLERRNALVKQLQAAEKELADKVNRLEKELKDIARLQYKASFDDADLSNVAYQLVDRILGTSVGRLSYDNKLPSGKAGAAPGKRGPAKARVYDIPDEMVEKFLVNDDDLLTDSYIRSLGSDIELTRSFGSIDPEDALKQIQDDYARLEQGISDPATLRKMRDAKNADLRDFQAVWERLRGTYDNGGADDYASGWKSAERTAMNMNFLAMLGGMTVSAFTDVGRPVMVHGIQRVIGDGIGAFATNLKPFLKATKDVMESGTALDMVTHTRGKALMGLDEFQPFANRIEAVTGKMANNYGLISLMAPWNAAAKQFTGVITQSRMLKGINKIAAGKAIGAKETEYLASNFIDASMAKRIAEQFKKHGEKSGNVYIPNARAWDDIEAQKTFRAAVRRDVDRTIVTPGQDKPLWMSRSGLRLLGQFRSFSVASTQRTLLAGLQQRDAAVLNGALLSVALGSLTYIAKSSMSGHEVDYSPANLIAEGIDRSGLLAWMSDANNIVEKVSRGRVGIHPLLGGPPMSRYASRSALEAVFGPTYGMIGNAVQITGNAFAGDWQSADTHTVRRLMPYQNLFYMRSIFDEAEANINEFFGVKAKR